MARNIRTFGIFDRVTGEKLAEVKGISALSARARAAEQGYITFLQSSNTQRRIIKEI